MPFVVDASVAIAWAFNERHITASHARARIRAEAAIVPALWWYELRNVLVLGERRGRLTERDTARFLRDISRLAISMDSSPWILYPDFSCRPAIRIPPARLSAWI